MIFGRKKRAAEESTDSATADGVETPTSPTSPVSASSAASPASPAAPAAPASPAAQPSQVNGARRMAPPEDVEASDDVEATDAVEDESAVSELSDSDELSDTAEDSDSPSDEDETDWAAYDLEQDWRHDGPFDYDEVDLEADDIERLDLGTLILTPAEGMELRLQMNEETQQVTSAMILLGDSALELTLFAAPRTGGMWADVRTEAIAATEEIGGSAILAKGPFGTELRRLVTVRTEDGTEGYQPSRTWVAEGPRWMLRGVVYGQASMTDEIEPPADVLHDVFCNLVVRRGNDAKAPGDIVSLELPEALATKE